MKLIKTEYYSLDEKSDMIGKSLVKPQSENPKYRMCYIGKSKLYYMGG